MSIKDLGDITNWQRQQREKSRKIAEEEAKKPKVKKPFKWVFNDQAQ